MQTRRNKLVFYIFAVAAIVIVVMQVRNTIELEEMKNPSPRTLEKRSKKAHQSLARDGYTGEMGNPKAPNQVVMLMIAADKEQRKTLRLLIDFTKQHPQDVYLSVFPMEDMKAMQKAVEAGIPMNPQMQMPMVSIVINGETEFTIKDASGQGRTVAFQRRPNTPESMYRSEDVITVLEQKIAQKP